MSVIKENIKYINQQFIIYSDKIIYRKEVDKGGAEDVLNRLGFKLSGPLVKAFNKEWEQSILPIGAINE